MKTLHRVLILGTATLALTGLATAQSLPPSVVNEMMNPPQAKISMEQALEIAREKTSGQIIELVLAGQHGQAEYAVTAVTPDVVEDFRIDGNTGDITFAQSLTEQDLLADFNPDIETDIPEACMIAIIEQNSGR